MKPATTMKQELRVLTRRLAALQRNIVELEDSVDQLSSILLKEEEGGARARSIMRRRVVT